MMTVKVEAHYKDNFKIKIKRLGSKEMQNISIKFVFLNLKLNHK